MARFKYLGEPARSYVTQYGPCKVIRVRCMASTDPSGKMEYLPVSPATEFAVDADIGHEITDSTSIRMLQADDRFEQIS